MATYAVIYLRLDCDENKAKEILHSIINSENNFPKEIITYIKYEITRPLL